MHFLEMLNIKILFEKCLNNSFQELLTFYFWPSLFICNIISFIILLDYIRDLASKALIHVYEYEAEGRKDVILKLLLKQLSEYMEVGNSGKDSSG